jgi:uncharacterized membrane protein YkvA (DUF1232 family)
MNLVQRKFFRRDFRWRDRMISLFFALKDPATPLLAKCVTIFAILYLLSPIDLIPDFIPVAGWIDDILIVPMLLSLAERSLSIRVRDRARNKASAVSKQFRFVFWGMIVLIVLLLLATIYRQLR